MPRKAARIPKKGASLTKLLTGAKMSKESSTTWLSYLRRVKDHWVNLVTGGTVTALLFTGSVISGYAVPSYVSLLLLGFFFFRAGYLVWREDRQSLEQLDSALGKIRPNMTVRLVVNQISDGHIHHHFQVKNIGEILISDLLIHHIGDDFKGFEYQSPVPRSLPRDTEFSIDGGPTLASGKATTVTVRLIYTSEIRDERTPFFTEVRFYLPKHVQPSTVDPDGRTDLEGSYVEEYIPNSTGDLLQQLEKPQGTVFLVLFSFAQDGKPNVSVAKTARRVFAFDAERGIALFATITNDGKTIELKTPLKPSKSGKYIVNISWDDEKGCMLCVNGHTLEDFGIFREYDSEST